MEIRSNSKLAFQAKLSSKLRQELQKQAIEQGGKTVLSLCKKIKDVNSWGHKGTILSLNEVDGVKYIGLSDVLVGKEHTIPIKNENSLLDLFMNLTKTYLVEKEMQLRLPFNKKFIYK